MLQLVLVPSRMSHLHKSPWSTLKFWGMWRHLKWRLHAAVYKCDAAFEEWRSLVDETLDIPSITSLLSMLSFLWVPYYTRQDITHSLPGVTEKAEELKMAFFHIIVNVSWYENYTTFNGGLSWIVWAFQLTWWAWQISKLLLLDPHVCFCLSESLLLFLAILWECSDCIDCPGCMECTQWPECTEYTDCRESRMRPSMIYV